MEYVLVTGASSGVGRELDVKTIHLYGVMICQIHKILNLT